MTSRRERGYRGDNGWLHGIDNVMTSAPRDLHPDVPGVQTPARPRQPPGRCTRSGTVTQRPRIPFRYRCPALRSRGSTFPALSHPERCRCPRPPLPFGFRCLVCAPNRFRHPALPYPGPVPVSRASVPAGSTAACTLVAPSVHGVTVMAVSPDPGPRTLAPAPPGKAMNRPYERPIAGALHGNLYINGSASDAI